MVWNSFHLFSQIGMSGLSHRKTIGKWWFKEFFMVVEWDLMGITLWFMIYIISIVYSIHEYLYHDISIVFMD